MMPTATFYAIIFTDGNYFHSNRHVASFLSGKIFALLDNHYHVARADIDKAAVAALRHRIILNFEGEAEGRTSDEIISAILASN